MTDARSEWIALLDAVDDDVTKARRALDRGEIPDVPAFVPPMLASPLPNDLVPRAQGLAARIADVQTRAERLAGELRGELDRLVQRRAAATAYHRTDPTPTTMP